MADPVKLLISARDPGAATHLGQFAKHVKKDPRYKLTLYASPPASHFFDQLKLDYQLTPPGGDIQTIAYDIIRNEKPNIILTGLSDPDIGIDEALQRAANNVPCYTYQDFWGCINPKQMYANSHFLTLDPVATTLSLKLGAASATTIGSLNHDKLKYRECLLARQTFRQKHKIQSKDVVAGLALQPLWHLASYRKSIAFFLQNLNADRLLVRFHPKQAGIKKTQILSFINRHYKYPHQIDNSTILNFTVGCDLITSAFSNTNFDLVMANRLSMKGFATSYMLWYNKELINWFEQYNHIRQHPLHQLGASKSLLNQSNLRFCLSHSQINASKIRQTQAARRLQHRTGANSQLAEFLLDSL